MLFFKQIRRYDFTFPLRTANPEKYARLAKATFLLKWRMVVQKGTWQENIASHKYPVMKHFLYECSLCNIYLTNSAYGEYEKCCKCPAKGSPAICENCCCGKYMVWVNNKTPENAKEVLKFLKTIDPKDIELTMGR